ncbi:Na/Pi symporter [Paraliomyxa miuraensis]|uniref:Na/Pi symporter n=1 Tax=Paraliomyxa miuraensis TaxID=376150 RepID=UPI00225713EA|nr:Na/Pi symporter [Paraliomyxa miuraensis]MCX4245311.1 Na/Pi symporter [Paraliomyxa miuraensis]
MLTPPSPSWLRTRAFRVALWWLLAIVLVVVGALDDDDDDDDGAGESEPAAVVLDGVLEIASVKPVEAYAGSAVIVRVQGHDDIPIGALGVEIGTRLVPVLHASEDQLVVEVPADAEPGSTSLRLVTSERRTAPQTIRIKRLRTRRLLRSLVGGLALFVFGLRTLAHGLRGYAGQPMRAAIGRWTGAPLRGLGLGVVAGGVGQSMLSVAAFVVGLIESRLLSFSAALVVLLGAHLGVAAAILVLPLGLSRQALWIVAAGVALLTMARHRRGESAGELVLGMGLLFYGLGVLRSGFQPIMGDPDVLPYLDALREDGVAGLGARLLAGTVLGALLQGPGAAFGLVLSISESTALLSPRQGLEIVAATNIGASLGTFVLALPFGRGAARLAVGHVLLCTGCTAVFLLLVPPVVTLGELVLGTDPGQLAYGKKILLPNLASHLALSFVVVQAFAVLVMTPVVPSAAAAVLRALPGKHRGSADAVPVRRPSTVDDPIMLVSDALVLSLRSDRRTMEATMALLRHGERREAVRGDEGISGARADIKRAVVELARSDDPAVARATAACVAVLHLQRSLEELQQLAERGIEKDYGVDKVALEAFTTMYELTRGGLDRAIEHLRGRTRLDIEQSRMREIDINAQETELRSRLLAQLPESRGREHAILWRIEVISTFENVGNHVYRIAEVLVEAAEDDF